MHFYLLFKEEKKRQDWYSWHLQIVILENITQDLVMSNFFEKLSLQDCMKLTFHNFSFIKQFQISLLNSAYIICSAKTK